MNDIDSFMAKVRKADTGCWEWMGYRTTNGYGSFGRFGRAHRVAYQIFVGPIPDGLVIDHLCRNRACVNPAHLELVTQRENILRGEGIAARNARKTHCPRGHEYSAENTYTYRGMRMCLACRRVNGMAHYWRKRGTERCVERPHKTHCPHGHEYTVENTYIDTKGKRHCRTCDRARWRALYAERKVNQQAAQAQSRLT